MPFHKRWSTRPSQGASTAMACPPIFRHYTGTEHKGQNSAGDIISTITQEWQPLLPWVGWCKLSCFKAETKWELNIADIGAAILVSVGWTKMYVSAMLDILKCILILEINHTRYL